MAGELVRDYTDSPTQHMREGVEAETATGGDGTIDESWGCSDVREALQYLLLERLRGQVVLQGRPTANVGVKTSLDAALIRRARRGAKHWTTVILQVLCTGVDSGRWGRQAVINQLQKSQSPNKMVKLRAWNGKDDRANVCPPPPPLPPPSAPSPPPPTPAPGELCAARSSKRTSMAFCASFCASRRKARRWRSSSRLCRL